MKKKKWLEVSHSATRPLAYRAVLSERPGREYFNDRAIPPDDANLVKVVEQLGDTANCRHATQRGVEIPLDVKDTVEEYDGSEHVAE